MMVESDLNLSMFRAYDIRTPSSLLTPELAERLARAEAVYIRGCWMRPELWWLMMRVGPDPSI